MNDVAVFSGKFTDVITCVTLAEESEDDEKKPGRKAPCHTAVDDENDGESQPFHSSQPLNRRSLSLVGEVI